MTSILTLAPEIFALFLMGVFLVLALFKPRPEIIRQLAFGLPALGVIVCLAAAGQKALLFGGLYRVDFFSQVFKTMLFGGFFLVACLCGELKGISEEHHPEFYFLLGTATLALMMLVSSANLVNLYLSLEVSSYSLYILVYLRKKGHKAMPAGFKYFLFGAAASALTLFGFALIYGAAQSTQLTELARRLPALAGDPFVLAGLVLGLGGFFFKLGVFPFHFWVPDVYEGAANPVAAYIATVSKVAAIGVIIRLAALAGGYGDELARGLIILSVLSMTVGNLCAIAQKDLKRLLAFSSIAHAGYVLIGVAAMSTAGFAGGIFYALALMLLKFTCFLVVVMVADNGQNLYIADLAGLHYRSPLLALALMLALFGLAGIPPTIGFFAKLMIFMAAIHKGYLVLVIIAMINVVISLYYYLQVLKAAYLLEPAVAAPPIRMPAHLKVLTVVLIVFIIMGGLYPVFVVNLSMLAALSL